MRAILRELGRPHQAAPSILIAGTNGKGSTSAMLASILEASGYRTGFYTSPHQVDIRERWMIGGALIDPDLLNESIDAIRDASDRAGILPTYFEALTLVAFVAFANARCDVFVLEVGMGGRLDATNVVKPLAAVITPIGLDHTEFLGSTGAKDRARKSGHHPSRRDRADIGGRSRGSCSAAPPREALRKPLRPCRRRRRHAAAGAVSAAERGARPPCRP
jgi:dihydrofolate synthase/folylpolyglutamate synthase